MSIQQCVIQAREKHAHKLSSWPENPMEILFLILIQIGTSKQFKILWGFSSSKLFTPKRILRVLLKFMSKWKVHWKGKSELAVPSMHAHTSEASFILVSQTKGSIKFLSFKQQFWYFGIFIFGMQCMTRITCKLAFFGKNFRGEWVNNLI